MHGVNSIVNFQNNIYSEINLLVIIRIIGLSNNNIIKYN